MEAVRKPSKQVTLAFRSGFLASESPLAGVRGFGGIVSLMVGQLAPVGRPGVRDRRDSCVLGAAAGRRRGVSACRSSWPQTRRDAAARLGSWVSLSFPSAWPWALKGRSKSRTTTATAFRSSTAMARSKRSGSAVASWQLAAEVQQVTGESVELAFVGTWENSLLKKPLPMESSWRW